MPCPQCGARVDRAEDDCAARFSALLARDHSRQEPWGSRHGLAFAAYTLQHPDGQTAEALDRCWLMLCRVYLAGDHRERVARGLRRAHDSHGADEWAVPPRPTEREPHRMFSTTIMDLGSFPAGEYARGLDAWCLATLSGWGCHISPY